MFIIDDILLSPVKGFVWLMRELQGAVEAESENEAEALTTKLSQLYMLLETGAISAEEFDAQERAVLDRLDELQASGAEDEAGADEVDDEDVADEEEIDVDGLIDEAEGGGSEGSGGGTGVNHDEGL